MGLGDLGLEDVGTQGLGDARTRDAKTLGLGPWDVETRGRDKQTTPDFCAEFVKYNFLCSRERYFIITFFSS